MWGTAWALGMPVIILGGIYLGIVTATEAAAVSRHLCGVRRGGGVSALTLRKFM